MQLPELVHLHFQMNLSVVRYLNYHASVPYNFEVAVAMILVALVGMPVGMHLDPEVICLPSFLLLIDSALTVDLMDFVVQLKRQLHCYWLDLKKQGTVYVSMSR